MSLRALRLLLVSRRHLERMLSAAASAAASSLDSSPGLALWPRVQVLVAQSAVAPDHTLPHKGAMAGNHGIGVGLSDS